MPVCRCSFVLLLVLLGCSSAPAKIAGSPAPAASSTGAPSPTSKPAPVATRRPSPPPSVNALSRTEAAKAAGPRPTGFVGSPADWVKAQVFDDESWGEGCGVSPHRGRTCLIPFGGAVGLEAAERGQIVLVAFEDDATSAAAARVITVGKGVTRFCTDASCQVPDAYLPYTAGSSARTVTFYVLLKTLAGKLLASSSPMSYRVL